MKKQVFTPAFFLKSHLQKYLEHFSRIFPSHFVLVLANSLQFARTPLFVNPKIARKTPSN